MTDPATPGASATTSEAMKDEPSAEPKDKLLPPGSEVFRIMFVPERWKPLEKLKEFVGPPFPVTLAMWGAIASASGHLMKYEVLAGLANRLVEQLPEDQAELDREGYSSALRSREFAALTETLICELYSALGGLRDILFVAYRKVQGIQKKSTHTLFERAHKGEYGPNLPEEIRFPLADAFATWFLRLYSLRVAVTHTEPGICFQDSKTHNVRYMHPALERQPGNTFTSDDIVGEINFLFNSVHALIQHVSAYLYARLEPRARDVLCGMYKFRMYQRSVVLGPDLTYQSGVCLSRSWFEKEPGLECPLRIRCAAYMRSQPSAPSTEALSTRPPEPGA